MIQNSDIMRKLWISLFILASTSCSWARTPGYPNSPDPAKWLEQKLIYQPDKGRSLAPQATGLPLQDLYFKSEDGVKLNAWYLPAPPGAFTVLYLHGNGGSICDPETLQILKMYSQAGMGVLALDYRGFGLSEGRPHEQAVYADGRAAYDTCLKLGVEPRHLLIHGHSLGGAVAIRVACEKQCAGLILESTFTSLHDMAEKLYGKRVSEFLISSFDTMSLLPRLQVPLLLIHGKADDYIPCSMSERLESAAHAPKQIWLIDEGGHNDLELLAGGEFVQRVKNFALLCEAAH